MATDLVNAHFKKFYPVIDQTKLVWSMVGLEYMDKTVSNIFPAIKCADGFEMSAQGHWGAYSHPRDDFADWYSAVEIMCKEEPGFGTRREEVGDEFIYPYVPIETVLAVIEKHGGLK